MTIVPRLMSFFEKAMLSYTAEGSFHHKGDGDHWDIFDEDYLSLIKEEAAWQIFRRNGMTCMLETGLYAVDRKRMITHNELYPKDYVEAEILDIIKRYDELVFLAGEDFVQDMIECEVGDPRRYMHGGAQLNFDDLYHVYAAWQLSRTISELKKEPEYILEIGGGYGNLSHKIKKLYPNAKYIILDLPESLVVQMGYLSQVNSSLTFFDLDKAIEEQCFDIALIPGWMREKIAHIKFDVIINMRSLGEMSKQTVDYYFDLIHGTIKKDGLFYCVNRYAFLKSKDAMMLRDFPFDDNWTFVMSQPQWLQTHLHEWMAMRSKPIIPPKFALASYPLRTPPAGPIMEDILSLNQWVKNEAKRNS